VNWRLGVSWAAAAFIGIWSNAIAATADTQFDDRHQIVVFYADETTAQAVRSANYTILLSALRSSANPLAAKIADNLITDATAYPAAVRAEATALLAAARVHHFNLAIFTNALALDGQYLLYRTSTGRQETRALPALPAAPSPALATSPLSRPGYFRQSLDEIARLYPPDSLDVILITNSHGGGDLTLTPLVFADLTTAKVSELSAALAAPDINVVRPLWAAYPGTTKVEYWRVIATIGSERGVRFPLVFRQTCESGISSWHELFSVPDNVGLVAHTANGSLDYVAIDYASVFDRDVHRSALVAHVAKELERQHIHVNGAANLWLGLAYADLVRLYPYLMFLPLVLWVLAYGYTRLRNPR
jgi:hypothetical protein